MRKLLVATLIIVAALATFACGGKPSPPTLEPLPTPTTPPGFVTFTDELKGFAILYPPEWDVIRSTMGNPNEAERELMQSLDADLPVEQITTGFFAGMPAGEGYSPSANVTIERLPSEVSSIEYGEAGREMAAGLLEGYKVRSESSILIGDTEAHMLDSEVPFSSFGLEGGGGVLRNLQVMVTEGRVGWTVGCHMEAPASDEDLRTCEAVVRSFRLLR